ncbi:MAG: NAD(P)-dependent oxidoreductase [Gammaproteobacteria bacterium]|nr:NAD(P)-dependent oxidoreductase [Gammaproteobacteria bacterium]
MSDAPYGFIGLGNMGGPMANNLSKAGHALVVHDKAGTQGRAPAAATVAASNTQVAQSSEVIFLSLPHGPIVADVVEEIGRAPQRRARIIVDTSTIGIEWAQKVAGICESHGLEYVDSPVSGGTIGAQRGSIAVMCAGRAQTIERLKPVMLDFGKHVFHIGDKPGQAQTLKVLNNFLSGTAMAATAEAVAFGVRMGLDMKTILDVVNVSSGQNTATAEKFPQRVLTETYDAGFRVNQINKDLRLYQEALEYSDAARPLSPGIIGLWQRLEAALPDGDITDIYPYVRDKRYEQDL